MSSDTYEIRNQEQLDYSGYYVFAAPSASINLTLPQSTDKNFYVTELMIEITAASAGFIAVYDTKNTFLWFRVEAAIGKSVSLRFDCPIKLSEKIYIFHTANFAINDFVVYNFYGFQD